MKTYNDIYIEARRKLRAAEIEAYDLEARLIMAYATGKSQREFLRDSRMFATEPGFEEAVGALMDRRIGGEPVAYIVGEWEFYGLPITVNPSVLIPRADTEILAGAAIEILRQRSRASRALDLCSGSGCVGIAIAANAPFCRVVLGDKLQEAVRISRTNIQRNGLTRTVAAIEVDALEKPPQLLGRFDIIVSNPPYIPTADISWLDVSVRDYEPAIALDGGEDGLAFYRAISSKWKALLKENGHLAFECGMGQAEDVCGIMAANGFADIGVINDLHEIRRVVTGKIQGGL